MQLELMRQVARKIEVARSSKRDAAINSPWIGRADDDALIAAVAEAQERERRTGIS